MKNFVTLLVIAVAVVGAKNLRADWLDASCLSCQKCDGNCCPKWSTEKVKKHCWNIEAKPVCIPAVRMPWECCDTLKCGRARCVNTLKKHEYECEKNVVKWDASGVVCPQPECRCGHCHEGCGNGGANGCGCGSATPMSAPETYSPPPAPAEKPIPAPPSAKRKLFSIPLVRR